MAFEVDVEILPDFDKHTVAAVRGGLRRLRDDIADDMHRYIAPHTKTGNLDLSIFCHLDELTGTIEGGATAEYAIYVELGRHNGHGKIVGRYPFVRPSFLEKRGDY